jgi:hypothetical protein
MINISTTIDKTHSHEGKQDACIPIRKRKMKWKKGLKVTKNIANLTG